MCCAGMVFAGNLSQRRMRYTSSYVCAVSPRVDVNGSFIWRGGWYFSMTLYGLPHGDWSEMKLRHAVFLASHIVLMYCFVSSCTCHLW